MLLWAVFTCQACKLVHVIKLDTTLTVATRCSLSASMLKPNTLSFTNDTLVWAATLSRSPEFPSDSSVALLIQYQKLLQDAFDLYQEDIKMNDRSRLAMHAKCMTAMLESWWAIVPPHLHMTCKSTFITTTNPSLTHNRPIRQQILLRTDAYPRNGPTIPLPSS